MKKYSKPDLGEKYFGIETIKKYVKEIQADYETNYKKDILGYVLWILNDYKRLKQGDGTNFSRIAKSPEALANYIGGVINYALRKESERSKTDHKRYSNMFQGLGHAIEWLKQESKE